jgi:alanine racemase
MSGPTAETISELRHFETAGRLTVHLGALKANWLDLAARAGEAECAAVVKADAYGLGVERVVPALAEAGCRTYFVALLSEARRVRAIVPEATIYVLEGLTWGAGDVFRSFDLRPVLGSLAEIEAWAQLCRASGARLPAAVHIDTGMNRLGLSEREAMTLTPEAAAFQEFPLALTMSHLSCAEDPEHPSNARHLALFDALRLKLPDAPASLANSSGTLLGGDFLYDLVRPGIAIYGGRALNDRPNPMRPVVRIEARVICIRDVDAGAAVGYGAIQHMRRDGRLAIVSLGYADGYVRASSSSDDRPGALVHIKGRPAPVVGRISMDMTAVDITDFPESLVQTGDYAEILGQRFTIDDLADCAGTIGYEVLTNLGRRFSHVVVDE